MSVPKLASPGRFARQYNNECYVDVVLLFATPESLESFKRQPQTSTAKRIRCEAPTTSQQATDSQKAAGQETAGAHDASAQKGIGQESSADADQPRQSLSTTRVQQEAQQGRQPAPKEQGQQHSGEGAKGLEQVEPGLADLPDPLTAQQGPGKQQSNVACKRKANGQDPPVISLPQEPEGIKVKATKSLLAGASDYFGNRIEGWDQDRWSMTGADGKPLLVVGLIEGLHEAAQAVVRLIYEEVVPESASALQLAKMCNVADMFRAPDCLLLSFRALAQSEKTQLELQGLTAILQLLPEAVEGLPEYDAWRQRCVKLVSEGAAAGRDVLPVLAYFFGDAHALLTDPGQLLHFRQLPFAAVKAWAASDELVVDSEDSVAVALGWWVRGAEGSKCNEEQLKELSGLLRVKHLTPAFRLLQLPSQPWFKHTSEQLAWVNVAATTRVFAGPSTIVPRGWLKAERQQLPSEVLARRTTITWDVPAADMQALFAETPKDLSSPAVYVAGSGFQLLLINGKRRRQSGVFISTAPYTQHGEILCGAAEIFCCDISIKQQVRGKRKPDVLLDGLYTSIGRGCGADLGFRSPADLEGHLVDGCFRLRATIKPIQDD